jgi:hypothetical protein
MKLRNWMSAKAVICVVFGLGFILLPETLLSFYAISAGPGGIFMTRLFGHAFIVIGLLLWLTRNTTETTTQRAIALAVFVGDAVGFIIVLMAKLSGTANVLGWSTVALYLVFVMGFGYFLLPGKAK